MITSINFTNFKRFQNYSISLKSFNILIGLNNSGKSTILDSLRILEGAYRFASRKNPSRLYNSQDKLVMGYQIPETSIPIPLANLQTNYNEAASVIKYRLSGERHIYIEFQQSKQPILYFETNGKMPKTAGSFRNEFDLGLAIIPTLGPLENEEQIRELDYVKRWSGSKRAPRLFRNTWYHFPDGFDNFKKKVENTWTGMSVSYPQKRDTFSNELVMFCQENRIDREISWAGFGFQIWLQLLTHIVRAGSAKIVVVDEPEVYLHPDLQHKILELLKELKIQVLLATHSVEIINNAEPTDVLLIDRELERAKRISDLSGLQNAANIIGSGQNIQLARLARGKKVLFVEGNDLKILSRLATVAGFDYIFSSGDITVIPVDGFSHHDKISNANWAFSTVLGEQIKLAALFDRDYRCEDEINEFKQKLKNKVNLLHVHERKEIENYLISPTALEAIILERLKSKKDSPKDVGLAIDTIKNILDKIFDELKTDTSSQLISFKYKYLSKSGIDLATIAASHQIIFESLWTQFDSKASIVPGKRYISSLNSHLQKEFGISISISGIASKMKKSDIPKDLISFFHQLNEFRNK